MLRYPPAFLSTACDRTPSLIACYPIQMMKATVMRRPTGTVASRRRRWRTSRLPSPLLWQQTVRGERGHGEKGNSSVALFKKQCGGFYVMGVSNVRLGQRQGRWMDNVESWRKRTRLLAELWSWFLDDVTSFSLTLPPTALCAGRASGGDFWEGVEPFLSFPSIADIAFLKRLVSPG